MLLRILIMFFLTIQASFGVSIVLDGTKNIISGSDCSTATYRFGTTTSYNGENLDIILEVTEEDNEYLGGACVDTQNGVVSFHIRDRDNSNNVASMDLKFTVVKHNTFTPVNVDTLTVTNFDLDSNDNGDTETDDVYYKNPLETLISSDSDVLLLSGDFYNKYDVKLRGKSNGNCNDSATLTELSCRAGAIWKNTSSIYARVQNDNAYGQYYNPYNNDAHRLIQFSFEYEDIAPLISDNNTSKDCGTYSFSTNSDSWIEGATHSQYDNSLNIQKNISIPNASQLKISFSGATEEDYDYLYIIDANGVEHAYSGDLNNKNDLIIDGSSVTLKFTSDGSVAREGVTITIESLGCNEDYDFGDAPNQYTHVSHKISPNLYLGNSVPDAEADQQSSADASGDGDDDNDGAIELPTLTVGDNSYTVPVKVFNNTGQTAYITAWIDFNRNGTFEYEEALNTNNLQIASSNNVQTVNVTWDNFTDGDTTAINSAIAGKAIMRIRLTTSRILRCDDPHYKDNGDYQDNYFVSPDGEVEDYEITIEPPLPNVTEPCGTLYYSTVTNAWVEGTTPVEYINNLDISKTIEMNGTNSLRITVSGEIEHGNGADYDWVYVYDENGNEVYKDDGNLDNTPFIVEGNKVTITLHSDGGATEIGATVKIEGTSCSESNTIDNPTLSLNSNHSILEGNSDTTDLVFPISLSKPAVEDIVLHYEITDINTTVNEDYILESNLSILIPKDANSSSIIIKVKGDMEIENNETFSLRLVDATNAIVDSAIVIGTIINDDSIRPIGCLQTAWMFQNKPTDINALNLVNGQMSSVKNNISDDNINAVGFNKKDGYFWGYNHTKRDGTISRIGMNDQGDWIAEDFKISGLNGFVSYVGDIDNNGHLYLKVKGSGRRVVVIDLDPNSPNYLTKINDFNLNFNLDTADWGFNPKDNKLYAVNNGSGTKYLYKIDPSNGHQLSKEDTLLTERRGFGASFFDANGFYYVYDNRSGNIYRIDVANSPNAVLFATADIVSLNDGAMCTDAEFKFDFGDLPENYPTNLESNGARHSLPTYGEPTIYLGAGVSHENNGKPSTNANLDEDDDGVNLNNSSLQNKTIHSGETTTLQITTHGVGYLSAWIDWNSDGDFNDTNEQIAQNIDGSSGLITLNVIAPYNLSNSATYARFRYSYQENLTPIGSAIDGEVEDYKINIEAEPIPIAEYRFDKCSWNGTVGEVKDSIGSINGTAHNNLTTNSGGKIQRAGAFNKSEEHYIDFGDNFNPNSDKFSISIWFKSNTTDGEQILYNKEGLYEAAIHNGYFQYAFQPHWAWDGGNSFPVEPNTWYHAVITYDGTKQRVYRNGVEVYNREETGGNIGSSSFNLLVGARNSNTPYNFFDGTIDEFKIYDGALSAKDINLTYQNEKLGKNWNGTDREAVVCTPPSPIAEYRFDKCNFNGLTVEDSSGNNFNGTIAGDVKTSSEAKVVRSAHFKGGAVDATLLGLNTSDGAKTTVSFWMNWNGSEASGGGQNWGQIPISWGEGSDSYNLHIDVLRPNEDTTLQIGFNTHNADNYGVDVEEYAHGWHHIVAIFNNGDVEGSKLYIDGVEQLLDSTPGRTPINSRAHVRNKLRIGGVKNSDQPYAFKDYLDEVKIFKGELTQQRIIEIYNNEKVGKNWDGANREDVVCEEAQEPFTCNQTLYISNRTELGTGSGDSGATWLHNFDAMGANYAAMGDGFVSNDGGYNAIGYNVQNNFIYALYKNSLLQIDKNANVKNLGTVTGLPNHQLYAGEFDRDGYYYVTGTGDADNIMYKIDITQKKVIKTITLSQSVQFWDMAIDATGEYFYTMLIQDTNGDFKNDKFAKIKISDGTITTIGNSHSDLSSYISLIFSDGQGKVIALSQDGKLYEIIPQSGKIYFTRPFAPLSYYNDGTSCPDANITLPPHPPRLSINNISELEGDSGETTFNFTVTADKPFDMMPMSGEMFYYRVVDGDGNEVVSPHGVALSNDHDFEAQEGIGMGMNMFGDGVSVNIPVTVYGDNKIEKDEEFYVEIYSPQLPPMMSPKYIIDKNVGIGTIINDDAPNLSIERTNSNSVDNNTVKNRKSFYTQIAGKDFDYAIVSYEGEHPYAIKDTTVKVELIDNNSTTANEVIYGATYLYLSDENARFNITTLHDLEIQRASRNAIFKVSYLLDENGTLMHGAYNNEAEYNLTKSSNKNQETYGYSDNFAIRPASYHIELNDVDRDNNSVTYATNDSGQNQELKLVAGYNYKLKAQAVIDGNNSIARHYRTINSKELNVTLNFDETGTTSCADTNISQLENYSFFDGKLNKNLSHDNVGKYTLHIEDINWTNIDKDITLLGCVLGSSSNIADETGRFGCNIASDEGNNLNDIKMTFKPYKFEFINTNLSNINGNGKNYTYMSDLTHSQKMGLKLHSTIIAKGKNNTTLTNFTKGCEATAVSLSSEFTVLSDTGEHNSSENFLLFGVNKTVIHPQNILRINDDNSTHLPLFNNLTLPKESFLNENEGNSSIDILYNMQRNFNEASNPIQVNFLSLDANATEAKAMMTNKENTPKGEGAIPNSIRTFYFTRIAAEKKNFPKTNRKVVKTPLSVEIYCKVVGNRDWCDNTMNLKNIGRNTYKTDRGWYLAVEHNSTVDGKINSLISSNDSVVFKNANPIADFIDGRVDNIETEYTNETLEGTNRADIAIDSDVWLRFNTKETVAGVSGHPSSYSVTFKSISNETGVGKRGYMLKQRPQVDRNGKMSW